MSDVDLKTEAEAAQFLGVKPGTLQVWRCTRRYQLAYIKVGRSVRYNRADLEKFLVSRTQGATA